MNNYKKIITQINVLLTSSLQQETVEYEEVLNETNTLVERLQRAGTPAGLASFPEYQQLQRNYEQLITQIKNEKQAVMKHIQKLNQSQRSTVMTYLQQEEGPSLIDMDL
ncbi:MAG: hypothetical protein ABF991_12810 [Liquorilactobacillus hordei]|uniref:hypothetical protein n=1 Tax=Liquorilactobacillus hordei TaxID=468911 RepID=UPI0039EA03A1